MKTNAFHHHNHQKTKVASLLPRQKPSYSVNPLAIIQSQLELAQRLRTLVQKKAEQGDYLAAIAILNQLISSYPNNAADYNNRGLMYFYNNQFSEAIADYNRAIKLNSRLDSAYNNRANAYAAQSNFASALSDYEIALDLNPGNLRAWINQGIAFRELGLYDLAIENFDLTLLLGQKFKGRIYAERGYTYHLRGDWNCAIADYHRALDQFSAKTTPHPYQQKVAGWLEKLLNPISPQ